MILSKSCVSTMILIADSLVIDLCMYTNMEEFKKLLQVAAADGVITDREKELLLKKAESLGIDIIEAELLIENSINNEPNTNSKTPSDGYDISDSELLKRIQKWVDLSLKAKEKVMVEPFPTLVSEATKLSTTLSQGQKAIGQIKDSGIIDAAANVAGVIPGAGFLTKKIGGAVVNGILGSLSSTKEMKLTNEEIVGTAKQYLLILDQRKQDNSWLSDKYTELKKELENNINTYNESTKKKGWW